MVVNLATGTALVTLTVLIQGIGLHWLSRIPRIVARLSPPHRSVAAVSFMVVTVVGVFSLHTVEIWLWAMAYLVLGALPNLHDALFFSTLSFSTLGAEEISASAEWRLLGSIEGVNGFLLIGWSTAFLIPAWVRHGLFREELQ